MSLEAAQDICRRLGLSAEPVFLSVGATCWVYRVGEAALRMGEGRFNVDAELRRALLALGAPVAEPIAVGENWGLDAFVRGQFSRQLSKSQAGQIGAAVSALHTLPVSGWGLLRDQPGPSVGEAANLLGGVQTRLQDAWPFGTAPLKRHPLMLFVPDLLPHLRPLEAPILALADLPPVVNHSDLYREQFLFEGQRLTGWLDFGDAVAGPPGWDAASFASFWGWERLRDFLAGYSSSFSLNSKRRPV